MDATDTGITLTDASVTLAGRQVLSGLSLALTERRIGIVGRNGSGKTTLLRLLAGLIAPSWGTVRVGGIDPAKDRKAMLARLGILFQNPDHQILFPTVAEELAFGLRQMGLPAPEAAARVRATLAAEGRSPWHDAPCHHLSQGQRQYLCLLAILMMAPQTILLDEPFAGVDPISVIDIKRIIEHLRDRGLGVLITDHNVRETLDVCEKAYIVSHGKLIAQGTPSEILDDEQVKKVYLGEGFTL